MKYIGVGHNLVHYVLVKNKWAIKRMCDILKVAGEL